MEPPSKSVLYIPGYGHNWTKQPFDEHQFVPSINRHTYPEIESHHVSWGIKDNPNHTLEAIQMYRVEQEQARKDETFQSIEDMIRDKRPSTIVTHSLGSRALYHAVMNGLQMDHPTNIVMLQPDIPLGYDFDAFYNRVEEQDITLSYTYCPWDNLLALASIYDRELRLGQTNINKSSLNPTFLPLQIKANQHSHNSVLYHSDIDELIKKTLE